MVVDYLQTCDFLVFISEASLKKLIRDEDCKILNAQTMAYGYISEKLSGRYQIIKELSKEGDSRNASMVRWMTVLTVYFLYQSVPDESIPERVRLNYEDVLKEIDRVASGKDNSRFWIPPANPGHHSGGFPVRGEVIILLADLCPV